VGRRERYPAYVNRFTGIFRQSLTDISQIPGLLGEICRLIEAHRNKIRPQPTSLAANRRVPPFRRAELVALSSSSSTSGVSGSNIFSSMSSLANGAQICSMVQAATPGP
jgi:hypothetical protein